MKTILLARHGQASFGSDNYDKLSDLGVQQAKLLGEYFAKHTRRVDQVFAGTLVRQQDSAKHFLSQFANQFTSQFTSPSSSQKPSLAIQTVSQFDEFNHQQILLKSTEFASLDELKASIANETNPYKRLAEMFKLAMLRWHSSDFVNDETGEYDESWTQFATRCHHGLKQVIEQTQDGQTSLVFTSGGVIASIASTLMKLPTDNERSQTAFAINRQLVNTGVTTIMVTEQQKNGLNQSSNQLLTLNSCEHLNVVGNEVLSWY